MQTAGDIIDKLGGPTAVADKIGAPLGTVSAWGTRNSIPSEYWSSLINLASALGKSELTYKVLAEIAAERRQGPVAKAGLVQ